MESTALKEKIPHFFKIILRQDKLGIPTKFARKYGNCLSDNAFLRVPNGPKWQIELVKIGDEIWLGNGWQNFVDYYSISLGSFLVFGFEDFKYCCFNVMIFDKSCSEIDYPFNEEPNLEEVLQVRPNKKRKQENCTEEQSEVKKSSNPSFSIAIRQYFLRDRLVIPSSFAKKYIKKPRGDIILHSVDGKTWSIKYVKEAGSESTRVLYQGWRKFVEDNHLKIGDVFVFELINPNPTEFRVVIDRKNKDSMSIPSVGNTEHLTDYHIPCLNATGDLGDSKNVKTSLQPSYLEHHLLLSSSTQVPGAPMEKFETVASVSSKVKKGKRDRCGMKTKFLNGEEKAGVLCRARSHYKSKNFSFTILMRPTHVGKCDDRYKLIIPATYARIYFKEQKGNIILNSVDGKTWSVEYVNVKTRQGKYSTVIRGGWKKFVRDNHLEVGDVCIFELINNESTMLLVVIFRQNQDTQSIPSKASRSNISGQM